MIGKRPLLRLAGAALVPAPPPRPAVARPAPADTLRFVPEAALAVLDPIWTTAGVTLGHGYCVFDTLYGTDERARTRPQMALAHEVSDDGRTWRIRLRDGLRFHDGEPVRAADCVASLRRWSARNAYGQSLAAAVEAWEAPRDDVLRVRLKRPFPRLLDALAHPGPSPAFVMPERLARTDPFTPVAEMVGSGPYRFAADEYVPGARAAYRRFAGYAPRDEPPSGTAGGKVARFERVEWHALPDPATAAAALRTGEVDWWDNVAHDLVGALAAAPGVVVRASDPLGHLAFLRFNSLVPPFDDPRVRRAVLGAVDQADAMHALAGGDPAGWRTWYGMFPPGLPFARELGAEAMRPPHDLARAHEAVRAAGHAGATAVVLSPSDLPQLAALGAVTAGLLRELGLRAEVHAMDWGSLVRRRASREPVERGGWSVFHTAWPAAAIANPAVNAAVRGRGRDGWFGWFSSPEIEALTAAWLDAEGDDAQQRLFDEVQRVAFAQAPSVPLGHYVQRTAHRADLAGVLPGVAPFFWNARRV